MRDVILAAAGEAVDATLMPPRETRGPAEPRDRAARARAIGWRGRRNQPRQCERARPHQIDYHQ